MFYLFALCIWVFCLCDCAPACGPCHRGEKKELDPLGLELKVVVSCDVDAGIKSRSSERASSAPNHWAISPAPLGFYFGEKTQNECWWLWNLQYIIAAVTLLWYFNTKVSALHPASPNPASSNVLLLSAPVCWGLSVRGMCIKCKILCLRVQGHTPVMSALESSRQGILKYM